MKTLKEKLPKSIITPCHCNQNSNVIELLLVRPDMILLGVFKWSLSTFSTGVIWALASDPTLTGSCPAILVIGKSFYYYEHEEGRTKEEERRNNTIVSVMLMVIIMSGVQNSKENGYYSTIIIFIISDVKNSKKTVLKHDNPAIKWDLPGSWKFGCISTILLWWLILQITCEAET